jgi:rubrerythrin
MEKFSIGEVIEMAVQTEKLGYQFYTSMADKFKKDEELKKLFETLALKEQRHEKTFSELKDKVGDSEPEGWEEAQSYFRAMVESEFFLGSGKSLPSMEHIQSVRDAVNFALGFEKETMLYFVGLRGAVKDKDTVDKIIKEEIEHIVWLVNFRRRLKN